MQVAVAVAGIEGLDGDGDQEVALSFVADALAARGVAHAFGLVERVRNVVGQCALLEDPLVVGSEEGGQWEQEKERQEFFVHRVSLAQLFRIRDLTVPDTAPTIILRPAGAFAYFQFSTHGLRRGLHSFAPSGLAF